jgi:hypothetical protein
LLKLGNMLELPFCLSLPMERPETRDAGGDEQNLGCKPTGDEPEKPLKIGFQRALGMRQHEYTAQGKCQSCDKNDSLRTRVSRQNHFSRSREELAADRSKIVADALSIYWSYCVCDAAGISLIPDHRIRVVQLFTPQIQREQGKSFNVIKSIGYSSTHHTSYCSTRSAICHPHWHEVGF